MLRNDDRLGVRLNARTLPTVTIVEISGEIDACNAEHVRANVRDFVAAAPALILDLSGVGFVSVAGFRALIAIHRECASANLAWVLITSDAVNLMLGIADRDYRLPAVNSMTAALELTTAAPARCPSPPITPPDETRC